MIMLPADPRFNPWRSDGSDIATDIQQALDTTPWPAHKQVDITARTTWKAGTIIRGHLDAHGEPTTRYYFPKPLSDLYAPWNSGSNPNVSIYSWSDGFLSVASGKVILMDMGFECPDVAYAGHHKERGYNPIRSSNGQLILINCWFYNCDSACVYGGSHSHVYNPVVTTKGTKRIGVSAHYGIRQVGRDNALEGDELRVNFRQRAHHNISTQGTRSCTYWGLRSNGGEIDFHCYSNDNQDDDNLHGRLFGFTGITIGGATSNKPWDGDNNHVHYLKKPDGSNVSVPGALRAIRIPDSASGSTPTPTPPPPATHKFTIGQRVKATSSLIIRSGPAKSTSQIGTQPTSATGTVLEGPHPDPASGYTYWKFDFDFGKDGYAGEDKLVAI